MTYHGWHPPLSQWKGPCGLCRDPAWLRTNMANWFGGLRRSSLRQIPARPVPCLLSLSSGLCIHASFVPLPLALFVWKGSALFSLTDSAELIILSFILSCPRAGSPLPCSSSLSPSLSLSLSLSRSRSRSLSHTHTHTHTHTPLMFCLTAV